jgi:hypothetical protein
MCYSPHPDRPRTPVALLKTEAEPAPPNEWTPDGCQRGCAVKCARRARSQPDAPTNDWRRSSKPQTRPRLVWRPRGREAFLCRDSRPQDRPARQFPKIPVRPTSLLFPAVHGRSLAAFSGLLCRVDAQKSLPIRLGFETREFTPNTVCWKGESRRRRRCDIFNAGIRQSGVCEKFADAGLDPEPSSASLSAPTIAIASQTH